jgi:prolyl oligopeptidase
MDRSTYFFVAVGVSGLIAVGMSARASDPGAPPAPKQPVVDTYHAVAVSDPYRWLESPSDKKVREWAVAQDNRTRRYLERLPQRKPIYERLMRQMSATSDSYFALHAVRDTVIAFYDQPPKQQPMIAVLGNAADSSLARIVVDPNTINPDGTTAIDWFVPSPDGKLVAVSLSNNGSEDGTLHLFEVASGKQLGEQIPRVQYPTAGGSVAWRADGKGFWYTRYPGPERPSKDQHFFQKLYFHRLGDDPSKDSYVLGKGLPRVAEISLDNRFNPNVVVVSVANGDGGEFAHYVLEPDGTVRQVTRFEDKVVSATIGPDNALYLVSRKGALRGQLLKIAAGDRTFAHAKLLVPESEAVIQPGGEFGGEPVVITAHRIYIRELVGGPSRIAMFTLDGTPQGVLPLPDVATVSEIEPLSDGTLLYSVETYLKPPYFRRFEEATGRDSETTLVKRSPVSFDDVEVVREFARSRDGTSIPLNIVRRRGMALDGSSPALLTGYGGYGASETPYFLGPGRRLWLDGGGVFIVANLRGGGEFGEAWHQAGALTHKQNVFDDFVAAAEYLIAQKYTSREHLAILGGSNGGLLMGAAFTQRPELFRAVVSQVGIYDMLRAELDPNGMFNTTEYGSVRNSEQFRALYAYSPYHHVTDGIAYPAIFMATGETDGRVNPAHSRKMIARLQAATSSSRPIYLSINSHAGHGIGSSLSIRVNQASDVYAFLFDQLGMQAPPE